MVNTIKKRKQKKNKKGLIRCLRFAHERWKRRLNLRYIFEVELTVLMSLTDVAYDVKHNKGKEIPQVSRLKDRMTGKRQEMEEEQICFGRKGVCFSID